MSENPKESKRWFKQVDKDLKSSKNSLDSGDYEWAFFRLSRQQIKL